jgi:hypothetical protein
LGTVIALGFIFVFLFISCRVVPFAAGVVYFSETDSMGYVIDQGAPQRFRSSGSIQLKSFSHFLFPFDFLFP